MTYKDAIKESMTRLSKIEKTVFIGYNTKYSKANNTLIDINENQLIETPVAENLMAGMAIGMSIMSYKPIVYFERFDFILNALDSIVNHLDKIDILSKSQYTPKAIIRVVIGGKINPLFSCITHTQNFTEAITKMVSFPVVHLKNIDDILFNYRKAEEWKTSMILIEERDLYNNEQ